MSESEGIKFSQFTINDITFDTSGRGGIPQSVTAVSHALRIKSDTAFSPVQIQAALTEEESDKLFVILNDVAKRIEKELKESLF